MESDSLSRQLQLAGMVDEQGRLDRPLPIGQWWAPKKVRVVEDRLTWEWEDSHDVWQAGSEGELLPRFTQLRTADTEAIAAFARSWGVLFICTHGLPAGHNPDPYQISYSGPLGCRPLGWAREQPRGGRRPDEYAFWEPVETWRHFARQAGALLSISSSLHQGDPTSNEDWATFYEWNTEEAGRFKASTRRLGEEAWFLVGGAVQEWLMLGNVRPTFVPPGRVEFHGGGLFGALAVQLAFACANAAGVAICAECQSPYFTKRKSRKGRRTFCPECASPRVYSKHAMRQRRKEKEVPEPG